MGDNMPLNFLELTLVFLKDFAPSANLQAEIGLTGMHLLSLHVTSPKAEQHLRLVSLRLAVCLPNTGAQ